MISPEQIADLAQLYGEFHAAIDPTEAAVLGAEEEFFSRLQSYPSWELRLFRELT